MNKKRPLRSLTRAKVLGAALKLADKAGIEALSMRNLAKSLKVEAMSLYNHVENKEGILAELVDLVAGEIELPLIGADWQCSMRRRAASAHSVLLRHPWATMLFVSRLNAGPNMLRSVDATLGCLREAGFSYALADHAWTAIDAYIYGFTIQKRNFPLEPSEYIAAASGFIHMIPPERLPFLHGMTREIIEGRHDGLHQLEFGLELILEGLERLRQSSCGSTSASGPTPRPA